MDSEKQFEAFCRMYEPENGWYSYEQAFLDWLIFEEDASEEEKKECYKS